jgi:hypothetical protein
MGRVPERVLRVVLAADEPGAELAAGLHLVEVGTIDRWEGFVEESRP